MSSSYHLVEFTAATAIACAAVAVCLVQPNWYEKAHRWLKRRASYWISQLSQQQQQQHDRLEPGEKPWPAEGFPGAPVCRPLSTVSELLTWQPPKHRADLVFPLDDGSSTPCATAPSLAAQTAQTNLKLLGADSSAAALSLSSDSHDGQYRFSTADPCVCTTPLRPPSVPAGTPALAAPHVRPGTQPLTPQGTHPSLPAQTNQESAVSSSALGSNAPGSSVLGSSQPQLLVCHDMMGGYLPYETCLSGSGDATEYRIWHWDCVDVFVYFSHHLVTVPPTGWIHAAHKHGVKVLGTLITEFGQGRVRCERLFSSPEMAHRVADQLVAIAVHYGFEGWLVNIENPLTAAQVAVMQHFVGYLRARTRDSCPHGMVVWYDAVTTAGKLMWQNGLTPLNAPFFDLADALFVNYTWTPDTLPSTTAAAGARASSVYMGVDVFGRGSYGGGGWGVPKALAAAAAAGLSAALFAPGWVRENLDKREFHQLQDQWWAQVQQTWGLSHPVVTHLPFTTAFNTGAGQDVFAAGTPTAALAATSASIHPPSGSNAGSSSSKSGWYNLLCTDALPCVRDPISQKVVSGPVQAYLTSCTSFEGGSCLVIYQQRQQQQPQQQCVAAAPVTPGSSSTGVWGSAIDITSNPPTSRSTASASGTVTSSAGSCQPPLTLLQLYTAAVPMLKDGHVLLQCVYAAPESDAAPGSSSSGGGGGGEPVLWLLLSDASSMNTDVTSTAAPATASTKLLLLPCDPSSSSSSMLLQGSDLQPLQGELNSSVTVQLVPDAFSSSSAVTPVGMVSEDSQTITQGVTPSVTSAHVGSTATLGRVHLLTTTKARPLNPGAAACGGGDGAGVSAAVSLKEAPPDALTDSSNNCSSNSVQRPSWTDPLPHEVGSWQWRQAGWCVPVPAGAVVVGLGVAVRSRDDAKEAAADGERLQVLALLGKVDVSVV